MRATITSATSVCGGRCRGGGDAVAAGRAPRRAASAIPKASALTPSRSTSSATSPARRPCAPRGRRWRETLYSHPAEIELPGHRPARLGHPGRALPRRGDRARGAAALRGVLPAATTSSTSSAWSACSGDRWRAAGRASLRCGRATRAMAGWTSTPSVPAMRGCGRTRRWRCASERAAASMPCAENVQHRMRPLPKSPHAVV